MSSANARKCLGKLGGKEAGEKMDKLLGAAFARSS